MPILQAIRTATSEIGRDYFLLPIAGRDRPIKRERVYCYELYHQLRVALRGSHLTLTGEPDKRGHPDFPNINPDLILHIPGHHRENCAVIEIECRFGKKHLTKDLKNLRTMRARGYQTLVLLLFAVRHVPWTRLEQAAEDAEINLDEITILQHRFAGEPAIQVFPPPRNAA